MLEPNVAGLTATDEMDLLLLETLLGTDGEFEPDLQSHKPDVAA